MHLPLHSRHLSKMYSRGFRTQITLQHLDLFCSPHQRDDWFFCWELFHSQIACVSKVVSELTLSLMVLCSVIICIFTLCLTLLYTQGDLRQLTFLMGDPEAARQHCSHHPPGCGEVPLPATSLNTKSTMKVWIYAWKKRQIGRSTGFNRSSFWSFSCRLSFHPHETWGIRSRIPRTSHLSALRQM